MIIGNGDIAKALRENLSIKRNSDDIIYFASGVSKSTEERESEYQREIDLLLQQNKKKHLVYFGSLCIFYANTRYAKHKKQMEQLVKKHFKHYTIIRLGNITWGSNPHTLINYLQNRAAEGKKLEIRNTYRYITSKKEFLHWIKKIPQDFNAEMNITGRLMTVKQIMKKYVKS